TDKVLTPSLTSTSVSIHIAPTPSFKPTPTQATITEMLTPTISPIPAPTSITELNGHIVFISQRTDFNQDGKIDEADGTDLFTIDASSIVITVDFCKNSCQLKTSSLQETRLTNDAYIDQHPRWSPDRKQIAFSSNRDGDFEIYVLNANGSGLRQITYNSTDDKYPDWSPDGHTLSFISNESDVSEVYLVDLDTNEIIQLTHSQKERFFANVDWSPTHLERLLVTTSEILSIKDKTASFGPSLWLFDLRSKDLYPISPNDWRVAWPRWSPDGSKILTWSIAANNDTGGDYYTITIDNINGHYKIGKMQPLGLSPGYNFSWSPDGNALIYSLSPKITPEPGLYLYLSKINSIQFQGKFWRIIKDVQLTNSLSLNDQSDWQ
ncbi:MAG: hypothetical protein U0401_33850, partial [Anaerolineae bacterium]